MSVPRSVPPQRGVCVAAWARYTHTVRSCLWGYSIDLCRCMPKFGHNLKRCTIMYQNARRRSTPSLRPSRRTRPVTGSRSFQRGFPFRPLTLSRSDALSAPARPRRVASLRDQKSRESPSSEVDGRSIQSTFHYVDVKGVTPDRESRRPPEPEGGHVASPPHCGVGRGAALFTPPGCADGRAATPSQKWNAVAPPPDGVPFQFGAQSDHQHQCHPRQGA